MININKSFLNYITFGSIVLVGALPHCALFHCVWDLKTTQMNMQRSLLRKLILYESELGHNIAETTKNCVKGDDVVKLNGILIL